MSAGYGIVVVGVVGFFLLMASILLLVLKELYEQIGIKIGSKKVETLDEFGEPIIKKDEEEEVDEEWHTDESKDTETSEEEGLENSAVMDEEDEEDYGSA